MSWFVDIESSAGAKIGSGPITSATRFSCTKRLDRAGTIGLTMAATDPITADVAARRVLRCRVMRNGVLADLGAGVVESLSTDPSGRTLDVAGSDLLIELARPSVHFLVLSDGAGGPMAAASVLGAIMASAPTGWTTTGTPSQAVALEFAGESVGDALLKVAELTGDHFRLGVGRQIVWLPKSMPPTYTASGIRAVAGGDPIALEGNPDVCIIESLGIVADSTEVITRIYPFGAGQAGARLTLQQTTRTAPAGYTLVKAGDLSYLKYDAGEPTADDRIERHESFKDVAVAESNTSADQVTAANALFDAALEYLKVHQTAAESYRLSVTKLDQALTIGTTIRVVWRDWVDGYGWLSLDKDLLVLETTTQIDEQGIHTVELQVSAIQGTADARWPASDTATLVRAIEQVASMDAHRQVAEEAVVARTATVATTVSDVTVAKLNQANAFTDTQTATKTGGTAGVFVYSHTASTGAGVALVYGMETSATPAAGLGAIMQGQAETTTGTQRPQTNIRSEWVDANDPSRKAIVHHQVFDTAARTYMSAEAGGSAATLKLSWFGATPQARPSAYTQTYSTASRTMAAYTADAESVAYTGAADGEAKLADLNALRVAYENVRALAERTAQVLNQVIDDLQGYGLLQ